MVVSDCEQMRCIAPVYAKGSTRANPVWVPCSRCGYCLRTRQISWSFRLLEEFKISSWTWFVTLTYDSVNLPTNFKDCPILTKHWPDELDVPTLKSGDLQLFIKRLRKLNARYHNLQLRYYAAGEYGSRYGRPHYHIIFFNLHPKAAEHITRTWNKGIVDLQVCKNNEAVCNYVASYVVTAYADAIRINKRPFSLVSKRPFLGHTYVSRMADYHRKLNEPFLQRGKFKLKLPRIFIDRIFDQTAKNSWKLTAQQQMDMAHANELHRLYLLNGSSWDGFAYLEQQRMYHEHYIRTHAKLNDKL